MLPVAIGFVVPHAGTWIESVMVSITKPTELVVPHAGTWIERREQLTSWDLKPSFPTRERGLKEYDQQYKKTYQCRSPRGNVD